MSDASSKPAPAIQRSPLGGGLAAILSLAAAGFIYSVIPVIAALILVIYPRLQGQSLKQIETWLTTSVVAQFFYVLLAEVLTMVVIFWLLKRFRWSWKTIGLIRPKWYHPLLGLATVVPYFVLYIAMAKLVSVVVPAFDITQEQQIGFDSVHGLLQLSLTFVSLVVLPPLVEEITMRGFLYTGLRKWLPRVLAALAVSTLFGAAHLSEGGEAGPLWIAALDTCILSLVLIGLREWTGNLWAGITLHATKNFVAFLALFIFTTR